METTTVTASPHKRVWLSTLVLYLVTGLVSFLVTGLIMALWGHDPYLGLYTLIATSFRTSFGFWETVKKFIPLLMATYTFAITYKIRLFNIGGLGQMQIGGIGATLVAMELGFLPGPVVVPLALLAAILAGGGYGVIAGWIWNKYRINPIISTVMLRFISSYLVLFVVNLDRYADPVGGHPMTNPFPDSGILPQWGQVPSWIILALIAIVAVYLLIRKTVLGFQIEATGMNPSSSAIYGIKAKRVVIASFFIAGAMAGVGGATQVMGVQHRLMEGFALTSGAEFGTFGILTSLVAGGDPIALPVTAFIMSVLLVGADAMQRTLKIPVEMVFLMQAILVLLISTLRRQIERRI